ncbi:hypothetical protein [Nonomuraea dietziae]|uniref:hypothetical protein n=1 Tax=Nonomuraea dietziae TaxID=65515 RepID=UPI0031D4C7C2
MEPAVRILWGAAMRCFWSEPGTAARRSLLAWPTGCRSCRRPAHGRDRRLRRAVRAGGITLDLLRKLAGVAGAAPEIDRYLGSAALQVGAFGLAARFSAAAAPGLRAQGRLGLLRRTLAVQAWSQVRLGDLASRRAGRGGGRQARPGDRSAVHVRAGHGRSRPRSPR